MPFVHILINASVYNDVNRTKGLGPIHTVQVVQFDLQAFVGIEVHEVVVLVRSLIVVLVPFHDLIRPDGPAQNFVKILVSGIILLSFLAHLDPSIIDFELATEGRFLDLSFQQCTHQWVIDYFHDHVKSDVFKKLFHLQDSLFRILKGPGYRDSFVLVDIDLCTKRPAPFLDLLKLGKDLKRLSRCDGNRML